MLESVSDGCRSPRLWWEKRERFSLTLKRRIGCTNRRCQKLTPSKTRARLVLERLRAVAVSQLAPKNVLSPKQRGSTLRRCHSLDLCDCRSRRLEGEGKQGVLLWNASKKVAKAASSRSLWERCLCSRPAAIGRRGSPLRPLVSSRDESYLVDPASSHMLVSKIKPCMSKYKPH